jgi:hypothetical protein
MPHLQQEHILACFISEILIMNYYKEVKGNNLYTLFELCCINYRGYVVWNEI